MNNSGNIIAKQWKYSNLQLFLVLAVSNLLIVYWMNYHIINDNIIYQTYNDILSFEQINKQISAKEKFSWFIYVFSPGFVLIRSSFTALCLNIGVFFMDLREKFGSFLKTALFAEIILILYSIVKIIGIHYHGFNDLMEIQHYSPLSLYSLISDNTNEMYFYPAKMLNIFQLGYITVLIINLNSTLLL